MIRDVMNEASRRPAEVFVIRVWNLEKSAPGDRMRGCIDHLGTNQRTYFTSLADLSDLIRLRLERQASS